MKDPLLDWLKLRGRRHRLPCDDQGDGEDYNLGPYILEQGQRFEEAVLEHLKSIIPSKDLVVVSTQPNSKSQAQFEKTKYCMVTGVPFIYQAVLRDDEKKMYGILDLLVRTDHLHRLFPTAELPENPSAPQLGFADWGYVVVDMKFKTLALAADGKHLVNSGTIPYCKTQVAYYSQLVEAAQGWMPTKGYLLGRGWHMMHRGVKSYGNSCLDRLGHISFDGRDSEAVERIAPAREWVEWIRAHAHEHNPFKAKAKDLRAEFFPNMKNQYDFPWHSAKKNLAERIGEITQMWYCGVKARELAHEGGVYSWKDERCTTELMGIRGPRIEPLVNAIMDVNRPNADGVFTQDALQIPEEEPDWLSPSAEGDLFIDFETVSNLNDDFSCIPHIGSSEMVVLVGCAYKDTHGNWVYRAFCTDSATLAEEKRILLKFLEFVGDKRCIHWSSAERSFLKEAFRRCDIPCTRMPNLVDALREFKESRIVIRGALGFGLKEISSAFLAQGLISSEYDVSVGDGALLDGTRTLVALCKGALYPEEAGTDELRQKILQYNRLDCIIVGELFDALRAKYSEDMRAAALGEDLAEQIEELADEEAPGSETLGSEDTAEETADLPAGPEDDTTVPEDTEDSFPPVVEDKEGYRLRSKRSKRKQLTPRRRRARAIIESDEDEDGDYQPPGKEPPNNEPPNNEPDSPNLLEEGEEESGKPDGLAENGELADGEIDTSIFEKLAKSMSQKVMENVHDRIGFNLEEEGLWGVHNTLPFVLPPKCADEEKENLGQARDSRKSKVPTLQEVLRITHKDIRERSLDLLSLLAECSPNTAESLDIIDRLGAIVYAARVDLPTRDKLRLRIKALKCPPDIIRELRVQLAMSRPMGLDHTETEAGWLARLNLLHRKVAYYEDIENVEDEKLLKLAVITDDEPPSGRLLRQEILESPHSSKMKVAMLSRLSQENGEKWVHDVLRVPLGKYSQIEMGEGPEFVKYARAELDKMHVGGKEMKEQLIDMIIHFAQNPKARAPVLVFYGKPGTGKSLLAKAIAKVLNRTCHRVELGGLSDPSVIRGSAQVWVGSTTGAPAISMMKGGSMNPVVVFDEVDKADPKVLSTLVHYCDPENRAHFTDDYLAPLELDCSSHLIILTCNQWGEQLSGPLADRARVFKFDAYSFGVKLDIAKKVILPRLMEELKLKTTISPGALKIFLGRTKSEPGVRAFERMIRRGLLRYQRMHVCGQIEEGAPIMSPDEPDFKKKKGVDATKIALLEHDLTGGYAYFT